MQKFFAIYKEEIQLGKDLKGKELGHGIMQKKNGRYEARYVDRFGKRVSISGRDIKDVKKRYNEAIYENDKQIIIKLDESKTLKDNANKFHKLYNKAMTSNAKLNELIEDLTIQISNLEIKRNKLGLKDKE